MEKRFRIRGISRYYWQTKAREPERWEITEDVCQRVIDRAYEGNGFFEQQANGRWWFTAYSQDLDYWVVVILEEDEETLFNAYENESETDRMGTQRRGE